MRVLSTLAGISISASVLGCSPNEGSVAAYHKCFVAAKEQELSDETSRKHCIKNHARPIPIQLAGTAQYLAVNYMPDHKYQFVATISNPSVDYVVTSYTITISRLGESPSSQSMVCEFRWIDVTSRDPCVIDADKLQYQPKSDEDANALPEKKWVWFASEIKGLKIDL